MEIEPERMDPRDRPGSPPFRRPAKWKLYLWGALALLVGGALLFFMFWVALFLVGLGLLSYAVHTVLRWFRGEKPGPDRSGKA
ncbi:MAG: hypothetical protein ACO3N7_03900 [Kiritimatiellia bacterium]